MKTSNDFTWYQVAETQSLIDRNLPRLVDEFIVGSEYFDICIVESEVFPTFSTFKVAFAIGNEFVPVYESGELYITLSEVYASYKKDGLAFLGIAIDES